MTAAILRWLIAALFVAATVPGAHAADPVVPSACVSKALTHAPQPPPDEKDSEMAGAGFTDMWIPVVMVYDRKGALRQAYNGSLDAFLAESLAVGRLDRPLADGLNVLLQQVGTDARRAASRAYEAALPNDKHPPAGREELVVVGAAGAANCGADGC